MPNRGSSRIARIASIASIALNASIALIALLAFVGCGDGETKETATSTTTSTSSVAASSSGMGGTTVNGCTAADADDQTAMTDVTITFAGVAYTPKCLKVAKGTNVTFSGDFVSHPLVGGDFESGVKTPDPASPIKETSTGMSAVFTLTDAGTYPYYCNFHAGLGMTGAIFVE